MARPDHTLSALVALARVGFEEDLYRLMKAANMSRSDLAMEIGTSTAYISKIFNGTSNYTLQTMAKLAHAVRALVQIRLVSEGSEVVRVMDVQSARDFDDRHKRPLVGSEGETSIFEVPESASLGRLLRFSLRTGATDAQSINQAVSLEVALHG